MADDRYLNTRSWELWAARRPPDEQGELWAENVSLPLPRQPLDDRLR